MANEAARREAETEICAGLTSNVGVKSAGFEPRVDGGANDVEAGVIQRMRSTRLSMDAVTRFRRTLAYVGGFSRWVLELAYDPRLASGAANDLLVASLRGGETSNLVALAPITERAQRLARRVLGEKADDASHAAVLRLLEDEAGKGSSLIVDVRQQAVELRDAALDEYAAVMAKRKSADRGAERAKEDAAYSRLLAG